MGLGLSYLSKPITTKESVDESNEKLICGMSSMQGWRRTQEDAYNCILDFDTNTSLFAVYDGHGGHEVAEYCSQELPAFIKNIAEYKRDDFEEGLKQAFLSFDGVLLTPEVFKILLKLRSQKRETDDKSSDEDDDEEENVDNLYKEADMPIEQVMEKYKSNLGKKEGSIENNEVEPSVGASSSSSSLSKNEEKEVVSTSEPETDKKDESSGDAKVENGSKDVESSEAKSLQTEETKEAESTTQNEDKNQVPEQNGEVSASSSESKGDVTSSTPVENGTPSKKGKGKAVIKPESVKTPTNTRPKRSAQQLYKNWLDLGEDSEDSDEEDQTFEAPKEESSEDEGEGVNVSIDASGDESSDEEEEDEEEADSSDEKDDTDDSDPREYREEEFDEMLSDMKRGPGRESGCTAVVGLLRGNELYVANAGDSRCIVCRNGKAIDMSIDHKPEDNLEFERIKKAGGKIWDGRVNGGLNLSRAIGDHTYKQNKDLPDREQMITALPDVKKLTINPQEDEFIFLACDGIWNSMSSQEVVDFIRPRLLEGREKLSQICEEVFDHCLSPNCFDDSAGCDNMTAIIIKLKTNAKRSASPIGETESKRAKTEQVVDTTA